MILKKRAAYNANRDRPEALVGTDQRKILNQFYVRRQRSKGGTGDWIEAFDALNQDADPGLAELDSLADFVSALVRDCAGRPSPERLAALRARALDAVIRERIVNLLTYFVRQNSDVEARDRAKDYLRLRTADQPHFTWLVLGMLAEHGGKTRIATLAGIEAGTFRQQIHREREDLRHHLDAIPN
jgi:hypothetical protein